jgi:hypothetical protein
VAEDEILSKEKEISTCRFTRTAPILVFEKLIHYCAKDNIRQYFVVCKAKKCRHLRPLRPPDEGSCTFVPKKQKEIEKKTEKKAEEKKNIKKPTSQDQNEEEFVEKTE